jgi:hypothetical protein
MRIPYDGHCSFEMKCRKATINDNPSAGLKIIRGKQVEFHQCQY